MSALVAVITAATPFDDAVIDAVAARVGAAARRLGPATAEIPFDAVAPPPRGSLETRAPVDINVVPAEGRRKSILIADMDSTIIGVECIDELADFAGLKPQVAAITERAMRGELDFEAALDARVGLLRGLPERALQECFDQRVRLNPGAREMVQGMAAAGAVTALVSGGFTFFAERVAEAAGFHSYAANVLEADGARLTGTVRRPILGREAKATRLRELAAELGVGTEAAVAIGDGANDLEMIRLAGIGVAYRAKPALRAEATAVLDHSDLTAVLALQGLPA